MHVPTLFLAIVLVGMTLAVAVGLVADRSRPDGMFLWAAGLVMHTGAYTLFGLRGTVPDDLSVVLANGCLSAAFAFFGESLTQFHGRRPRHGLLWLPVPLTLLVFAALMEAVPARLMAGPIVFGAQAIVLVVLILSARKATVGRGQYFMLAGMGILLLALAVRAVSAARGNMELARFGSTGVMQLLTYVAALCSTLLTTLGFVLMGKERAEHNNRQLAMLDHLTGLPNRRCTLEALSHQVAQAHRTGQALTVLMVDVDHFKRVNDTQGHLVGDAVLHHVASTLLGRMRGQDLLGRIGGEEFLAILPATSAAHGGLVLAEALRDALAAHPHGLDDGQTLPVTVSLGVAEVQPGQSLDPTQLLGAADLALYRAKAAGRNRVESARPEDYPPAKHEGVASLHRDLPQVQV